MNDETRIYLGLALVLILFIAVITALLSFAGGPTPVVVVAGPTTTTMIEDELIPAISIAAPPPTLSQRAETYAVDTQIETQGGWVDSLSSVDLVVYVRGVCDEFDRGLWFWDMYERRLSALADQGWTSEADATALQIVMGDGVLTFCAYNEDRLPSELLGD